MPIPFQTLRHRSVFVHPTQRRMYDPFIDSLHEEQPLQVPLSPSRPVTPAVNPVASNVKLDPAVSQDAAALFDPLGFIPTNSRVTQEPAMAPTTRATPNTTYDPSAQPKRRAAMLTISTPTNPPLPLANPLEDLLGTRDKDGTGPSTNARIKPTRQFSTTPLFQPPPMSHTHPLIPPPSSSSRPNPHVRGASDDFGTFVSVPPSLDPLSSVRPTNYLFPVFIFSGGIKRLRTSTEYGHHHHEPIHDRSNAATRRESNRILGEFARSEAADGDFLGWLDDDERKEDGDGGCRRTREEIKVGRGPT